MSCDDYSFCTSGKCWVILNIAYGFVQHQMIEVTVCLYGFTVIMYHTADSLRGKFSQM